MKYYYLKKKCALCNSNRLNLYLILPKVPCGEQLYSTRKKIYEVKMDYYQCLSCKHIQLKYIPNQKILWKNNYTFIPSQNPLLKKHFLKTISYLQKKKYLKKTNSVFEIGANDGLFLNLLKQKFKLKKVVGIDPARIPVMYAKKKYKIKIILDYFNKKKSLEILKKHKKFDLIVANNCFAHMKNLNNFLEGVKNLLSYNGCFVFETSALLDVVKKMLIGTMIHEHMSIHSIGCLKLFFKKFNLEIVDLIHNPRIQGGIYIGVAKFIDNKNKIVNKVLSIISKENKNKINYIDKSKSFNKKFHNKLKKFSKIVHNKIKNDRIVALGASRSAGIIIKLLNLENKINFFLDADHNKIGKLFPINYIDIKNINDVKNFSNIKYFVITGWAQHKKIISHLKKNCKSRNFYVIKIFPTMEIVKFG